MSCIRKINSTTSLNCDSSLKFVWQNHSAQVRKQKINVALCGFFDVLSTKLNMGGGGGGGDDQKGIKNQKGY